MFYPPCCILSERQATHSNAVQQDNNVRDGATRRFCVQSFGHVFQVLIKPFKRGKVYYSV